MLKIFVSSTIADLAHLREGIREQVEDMGHLPVMSEFGEIGFLPSTTAEGSCYVAMAGCDLAILIIGKRYGSVSENGVSITQNEYRTAVKNQIPSICLIEAEVMSFKKVYDANPSSGTAFPQMDNPGKTFSLINEITSQPVNNGIVQFTSVTSAKVNFKRQLNLLFADLMRKNFSRSQNEINEILSEVVTLRKELLGNKNDKARPYIKAYELLVTWSSFEPLKYVLMSHGPIEDQIPTLLEHDSLTSYFKSEGLEKVLMNDDEIREMINCGSTQILAEKYNLATWYANEQTVAKMSLNSPDETFPFIAASYKGPYRVNKEGDELAENLFSDLKRLVKNL